MLDFNFKKWNYPQFKIDLKSRLLGGVYESDFAIETSIIILKRYCELKLTI